MMDADERTESQATTDAIAMFDALKLVANNRAIADLIEQHDKSVIHAICDALDAWQYRSGS